MINAIRRMFASKETKHILSELSVLQEYCGFDIRNEPDACMFFLNESAALGMNMRRFCEEVAGPQIEALQR